MAGRKLESLLLVDANARSRGTIAFGFAREGCLVRAASDEKEALRFLEEQSFDLVVLSGQHEVVEFIKNLRALPAMANVPIIVLADGDLREAVLAAGADEYLVRPAFLRDLLTVAKLAFKRRQSQSEVEGDLAEFGLYFLVRALNLTRRSAVLAVARTPHAGELSFCAGELVNARLGRLSGLGAFLHMLLWDLALFRLRFETNDSPRVLQDPTAKLLEDGRRFVAEFEAHADRVGGIHAVYRANRLHLERHREEIPEELQRFALGYDGCRLLIDVIADAPFRPFDAILLTAQLADLGIIIRCPDTRPVQLAIRMDARDWVLDDGTGSKGKP